MIVLMLLSIAGFTPMYAWILSAIFIGIRRGRGGEPPEWLRSVFWNLRPFYLLSTAAFWIYPIVTAVMGWLDWFAVAATPLIWIWFKDIDGDDDRWKRRRAKARAAIQRLGDRLVIVPTPATVGVRT